MLSTTLLIVLVGTPAAEKASWESVPCSADVVTLWREVVEGGCKLPTIEDRLPLALRLLRNTPYAAKGHSFKTKELGVFFTKATRGCKTSWYRPSEKAVVLPEREVKCAKKLKKLEVAERKKHNVPAAMETYTLENLRGDVVGEIRRAVRGQKGGTRLYITRSKKGWRLNFNESFGEEGAETESSTIVSCDSAGQNCRVDVAG